MDKHSNRTSNISAQPHLHQHAAAIQAYGTVNHALPLELEEPVRLEMTERLNQLLADTITIRDLYKKSHWQVAGASFYQLHLLFDKHYDEHVELVDSIAERIQLLGGVSLAMAADVAEETQIERPPRGREEVPVQLSRLLDAHQVIIRDARTLARRATQLGDDGTNSLGSQLCPGALPSGCYGPRFRKIACLRPSDGSQKQGLANVSSRTEEPLNSSAASER